MGSFIHACHRARTIVSQGAYRASYHTYDVLDFGADHVKESLVKAKAALTRAMHRARE
jgi:hypothetical protein